jgi:PST family polysaccharide transporter
MTTLRRRAVAGVFWVTLARMASRSLSFLSTGLILPLLLTPDDFGLVWAADLAINALLLFEELGLGAALIYRKDRVEEAADTAFVVVLAGSLLFYAGALMGAPYIAGVFTKDPFMLPRVIPVLRTLSLTLVISAVAHVPHALLSKELDFKRKIVPQFLGGLTGACVSIALALSGAGVKAIVIGRITHSVISATAVWFVVDWRPTLQFSTELAKEMLNYAKHILGSQILVFLITNIDDAFVSRIWGARPLGNYGFAYKLSNTPATEISRLISQVMFPTLSKVGEQMERMKSIYLRTTRYVSMLSIPLSLGIIAFAEPFILSAYGRTWAAAILPVQLLGVYGMLRSIAVNMGSIFKAGGKPKWLMGIATWRLVTMAALLYPVTVRWGIEGVSGLSAAVSIVDFGISMYLVNKIIGASVGDYVKMLGPIFILAGISVSASRYAWPGLYALLGKSYYALPVCGLIGVVLYAGLTWLTDARLRAAVGTFRRDWMSFYRELAGENGED